MYKISFESVFPLLEPKVDQHAYNLHALPKNELVTVLPIMCN